MQKLSLEISGMSCSHCVGAVRKALEAVPGVHVEQVGIGTATVAFDASKADRPSISGAVDDAGFVVVSAS